VNRIIRCLCTSSLILATVGATAAEKRGLALNDFDRLLAVDDLACSDDGRWIAYTVEGSAEDADERRSSLWMVSFDGSENLRLTSPSDSVTAPKFSPDGHRLAFLSARGGANTQIYVLDLRGGDAQALTPAAGEVGDYAWAPDGQRLVFSMPGETEPADKAKVPKPIVIDRLHFKEDRLGYLSDTDRAQLYLLDVRTKEVMPLTTEKGSDDTAPVFSPDGKTIAFFSDRDSDWSGKLALNLIEARPGAAARRVAEFFAPNKPALLWTRDGTRLLYTTGLEPRLNAYIQDHLSVLTVADGKSKPLADRLDRALAQPALTADDAPAGERAAGGAASGGAAAGNPAAGGAASGGAAAGNPAAGGPTVNAILEDDGSELPVSVRLSTGRVERRVEGPMSATSLCSGGGHTAVAVSTDRAPTEVFALEGRALRQLTHHNDAVMEEVGLGSVEDIAFPSRDGTTIHGLMVKPREFRTGQTYPTLLWIHGGPNGQDSHGLAVDTYPLQLERQWFAAHGYVVLAVNYRGSSGRGAAFAEAILADWGDKEVADLLAAADYAVRSKIADPQRLGIGGWSYGGLLTDYVIASDPRFAAAISGAGSGNQLSMFGSDQYILQYNGELGPPWRSKERWLKVSYPFFHADRIKTPTLFLGGDKDFNVPVAGGEQMYEALRTLKVPTQLIVYPGQYHLLTRPSYIKDRIERYLQWFDRYLKPPAP
jgi:dipeptidyl aminopeptidase/acylaminoacyl peptidase